ncbi:D-alanyl-D-alanine carboxypeptidase family protein [Streptomyces thioluteus]|uniref:D-alanyl-D-alanine carboxypeptidase family protein n=1 Tax=Streptomyces thioluteus TaxID=66431 RepID=UPI003CD09049
MNQLQTPKASRNQDTGRERTAGVRGADDPEGFTMGFSMRSGTGTGPIGSSAGDRAAGAASEPRRRGTFTGVPMTTSQTVRRRGAALVAASASLLLPLAAVSPAFAAPPSPPATHTPPSTHAPSGKPGGTPSGTPSDGKGRPPKQPPAKMSEVGGELLGRPGVQVRPEPGAPALPRSLSGDAWLVADAESGEVLAAKNAHWRLAPASTLKMLFADTVLPKFPKTTQHKVLPTDLEGMGEGSSQVGLKEESTYSVQDLWLGVFLRSGNDAVHVLAAMNGGVEQTVRDMQAHAEELQANDTHVVTPDGYDADGQVSSAYDLTLFARSGLQKKDFREYCATATSQFPGEEKKGKKRESFGIQNTNRLLTGQGVPVYQGIAGVKNGSTTNAGNTFTGVAQHGSRKLLVTVMNPETKEPNEVYKESAALLDWGFEAVGHVKPVGVLVPPLGGSGGKADGSTSAKSGGKAGDKAQASVADSGSGGGGLWTAVGITGGSLAVLAGAAYVVHRRWPLRRPPRA